MTLTVSHTNSATHPRMPTYLPAVDALPRLLLLPLISAVVLVVKQLFVLSKRPPRLDDPRLLPPGAKVGGPHIRVELQQLGRVPAARANQTDIVVVVP